MAQGTVYNIPVAGTESSEDELPKVLPLPHLGIVFHPHVEGIQFMPGDVSEQLRQIEPSQKLYRGIKVS